jgi:hypothetical protein
MTEDENSARVAARSFGTFFAALSAITARDSRSLGFFPDEVQRHHYKNAEEDAEGRDYRSASMDRSLRPKQHVQNFSVFKRNSPSASFMLWTTSMFGVFRRI